LAEPRAARGVAEVAAERELAAAAEREAVDRGDRRLRHLLEQPRRLVAERAPALRSAGLEAPHVLDVRARDEGLLSRAGEDDDARGLVLGELTEAVPQLGERLDVEGVEGVLPVDRDEDDSGVLAVDDDRHAGTAPRMKSTISPVGAPGPKTPAMPSLRSSSASSSGIVPPTTTTTSSAPSARRSSKMRGTSVMCAPERIEMPTASASSWIAVSTICSGVWWRPV